MAKVLKSDGTWYEGKASPELKPEHLRKLPANYVTKDIADPDKIHELDVPHIVDALTEEQEKRDLEGSKTETMADALPKLKCAQPGETVPLSQWEIDVVRMRVIKARVDHMVFMKMNHNVAPDLKTKHLWFPEDNVNIYELREGNPPADKDRPKHMRGLRLEIDVENLPPRIVDALAERGVVIEDVQEIMKNTKYSPKVDLVS